MKKALGITIGIILLLGGGYFGFTIYDKKQQERFNAEYLLRIDRRLENTAELIEKIAILEEELKDTEHYPQSEQLTNETKQKIAELLIKYKDEDDEKAWLLAVEEDTEPSYLKYLEEHREGKYSKLAKNKAEARRQEEREKQRRKREREKLTKQVRQHQNFSSFNSGINQKKRPTKLILKQLTCIRQQEISGSDQVSIWIDNKKIWGKQQMKSNDTRKLEGIIGGIIELNENSYYNIKVIEEDDGNGIWGGNDRLITYKVNGNDYELGNQTIPSKAGILKYELICEFK